MANPTVQSLIDRSREILNETASGLYVDSPAGFIGWCAAAQNAQHQFAKKQLRNQGPLSGQLDHPYLRHWRLVTAANTVSGTQEYSYSTADNHDEVLFIRYGSPLRKAVRVDLLDDALSNLSRILGARPGLALWAPYSATQFRIHVIPGRDGVPREATAYEVWCLKTPTRFTLVGDLLDVPYEYTNGIVWYMNAMAVMKERKLSEAFMGIAQAEWQLIP